MAVKKKNPVGRPPSKKPAADRAVALNASVRQGDLKFLRAEAKRRRVGLSFVVREAVERYRASIERARKRRRI